MPWNCQIVARSVSNLLVLRAMRAVPSNEFVTTDYLDQTHDDPLCPLGTARPSLRGGAPKPAPARLADHFERQNRRRGEGDAEQDR